MYINNIIRKNSYEGLQLLDANTVNLVYLDPPFFTQKNHKLKAKNGDSFAFSDKFDSLDCYLELLNKTLIEAKRVLKDDGSIFLHCDKTASHHLRLLLDNTFGAKYFQSEIIWSYKRWSNAKKGLLNGHQVIFFYSKTKNFKFNTIYTPYSVTTNVDQIQQLRKKGTIGKSTYQKDNLGNIIFTNEKKGVPLNDVWEIPYLNPKAHERTGYPTQKPVTLLKQIISIASDPGDLIVDPFCGSGTTCIAAKALNRNFIGIDISEEAVKMAQHRIDDMKITNSKLLTQGVTSFSTKTPEELAILKDVGAIPVHRNQGIDGLIANDKQMIPVKIQAENETLTDCIKKINQASRANSYPKKVIIQTKVEPKVSVPDNITIFQTLAVMTKLQKF